jgi:hypothetical protein
VSDPSGNSDPGRQVPDDAIADIHVDPVEVTPGLVVEVPVQVTNRGPEDRTFALDLVGIEPEWVEGPVTVGPLAPGERQQATLRLQLPAGHPACRLLASLAARPTPSPYDQTAPTHPSQPATADLILIVGDGSLIGAALEPTEVRGAHRGRFDVVLHNRGKAPVRVDLRATAVDPGVHLRFRGASQVLGPGAEVRVRTQVQGPRPVAGARRRRPFGVRIQGRGTPVVLEGSFTQRPYLSSSLTKAVAIVAVVALWVTVAAVGISALDKHIHTSASAKSVAGAPPLPVPAIPSGGAAGAGLHARIASHAPVHTGSTTTTSTTSTTTAGGAKPGAASAGAGGSGGAKSAAGQAGAGASGSSAGGTTLASGTASASAVRSASASGSDGASGSGGASGSSGSGSGGSGSSGSGSNSSGSGGSGSGGSGSGGSQDAETTGNSAGRNGTGGSDSTGEANGARVSGKVNSTQPGGVTVSIAPTSLVDENTEGANLTTTKPSSSGAVEVSEISSSSAAKTPIGKVYGTMADATFHAGLTAETTPRETTTTTPDGSWAFAGLRAPGDYLVTFSKDGFETSKYIVTTTTVSAPVTLSASLTPGRGSVSGTVTGPAGPLGDADITISDGTVTAATKTPTLGATGTWSISGLSTPDTYLVTATAPGYGAQTSLIKLTAGDTLKNIDLALQPGVATITGTVTSAQSGAGVGDVRVTAESGKRSLSATTTTVAPVGSYALPNLTVPGTYTLTVSGAGFVTQTQQVQLTGNAVVDATLTRSNGDVAGVATSSSTGDGLAGAGAVLANDKYTFKTLTESAAPLGGYDFGEVPPGQYVLTVEDFGYTTTSAEVTVTDGTTATVNLSLPYVGAANEDSATIEGSVSDVINATPIANATLTLDGGSTVEATTNSNGTYQITGVGPGLHTVTATAKGYESTTVQVSVTLGGLAFAPPNLLPIEDTVAGIVVSNAGGVVPDPSVQLVNPATGAVVGATTTPLATPTETGIPAPALGGFEIDDVPHGNYLMKVSAPPSNGCGTDAFVPIETPVTVAVGTNLILTGTQSPALNLAPSFNVITLEASASSLPTQVGGVAVTVTDTDTGKATTCASPTPPTAEGATPTDLTFPNLVAGDAYQATFSLAGSDDQAPAVSFTGTLNNASVDTILLATPVLSPGQQIALTLEYPYRVLSTGPDAPGGTVDCYVSTGATPDQPQCPTLPAADLPTVQMTGTVGYSYPSPGQPTAPIQQTFTAQTNESGTWTLSASATAALLPSSVTFTVSDPSGAFEQFTKTDNTADDGFSDQSLLLNATPAPTPAITVTPASGVTIATTPVISSVSLSESGGSVVWSDSASATPGSVEPGIYELTFAAPDYDSQEHAITIPFQGASCAAGSCTAQTFDDGSPLNVALVEHVSLAVTPASPGFDPSSGLGYPTVSLADASGPIGTPVTLSATQATATFTNLSVADTGYVVTITQAGYATYTSPVTLTETPVNALNPVLVEQGWITGIVEGQINTSTSVLEGVSVQATLQGTPSTACPATVTPVISDANGEFTLTGDPSATPGTSGGLCVGATYALTSDPDPTGYVNTGPSGTIDVTITAGDNDLVGSDNPPTDPIVLTAILVTETVHVTDSSTQEPIPGASVVALSGVGVNVGNDPPTNAPVLTDSNGNATLSIDPTTYTFEVSATQYATETVGPVPFSTTDSTGTTVDVVLTPTNNVITGTLSVYSSTGPGTPLPGVVVTLYSDTTSQVEVAQATTDSSGTYSFTAEPLAAAPLTYIPDGNYLLSATVPGYSYVEEPQVFATAPPSPASTTTDTVESLQFQANLVAVDVAVSSTLSESDILGATVTLSPAGVPTPALTCAAGTSPLLATGLGVSQQTTLLGPTASFINVVPDYYSVQVSGEGAPTQIAGTVLVCPGGTTSASFQVQEGEISGTVTAADGTDPSTSTIDIYSGATTPPALPTGTPIAEPAVSCAASTCTFSTYVPLGSAYTAVATLSGFGTQSQATATLTSTAPTDTFSPALVPADHTVDITVQSNTTPAVPAPSDASVTLALSGTSSTAYTGTPDPTTAGQFDFTGVAPDPSAGYNVTATFDGLTYNATLQIPIEPTAGNDPIKLTVGGAFGSVSGTVTAADGVSPAGAQIALYSGATTPPALPTGTPVATPAVTCAAGTCSYTTYVALGAYTVVSSLTGFVTQSDGAVDLGATAPTANFSPALAPADHQVQVTVQSDAGAPLPAPTDATVTLASNNDRSAILYTGTADATVPGAFDFSGVAPDPAVPYYVTASFDDVTVTGTVTVPIEPTSDDPITQTITGPFALVNGTVTLNPAPTSTTPVSVQFCANATCATTVAPNQTADVGTSGAAAPYSAYVPAATAATTDYLLFTATGYTASAPVPIAVNDGETITQPPEILTTPPSPPG